jgi:hypothetical protein
VPLVDGDLAGENGRAAPITFLEDLVKVTTGTGIERFEAPIVKDEELDAGEAAQDAVIANAPAAHRAIVELVEQSPYRRIELGQREEASIPQPCQDSAPDDLDADFSLGLVAWLVGARRYNGGAVMPRHVGVGPVDHRFVKAGLGNPGLEIVADGLAGDAAENRRRRGHARRSNPATSGSISPQRR